MAIMNRRKLLMAAAAMLVGGGVAKAEKPKVAPRYITNFNRPEDYAKIKVVAPKFKKQEVSYDTDEAAGTIVIETRRKFLYYVLGNGRAIRYGVGVGRDGFGWSGTERITRKAEWPDWHPPAEMRERQPELPEFVEGGEDNPLGARALYLGNTEYRIHGTMQPWTIGRAVSSGCIRMTNDDVIDLYKVAKIGTKVIVR